VTRRAAAIEYLSSLFPDSEPCFLCDEPVGSEGTLTTFPDLAQKGVAIAAAECMRCAWRRDRGRRERRMLRPCFCARHGLPMSATF
jgi:hypothetical protein